MEPTITTNPPIAQAGGSWPIGASKFVAGAVDKNHSTDPSSKATSKATTDSSKLVVWDPKEIKGLCDGVFDFPVPESVQKEDVHDAIAGCPGSNPKFAEEVAWMEEVPVDFLLDKSKHKKNEWLMRFQSVGLKFFWKGKPVEVDRNGKTFWTPPLAADESVDLLEEFKKRMKRIRSNIINALHVETNREFKSLVDQCVPELNCKSFDHFLVLLRTKTNDNSMRRIVHIVSHTMWSRENFIRMERTVMNKLRIRYGSLTKVDGTRIKHTRRAGCIAKIGTRLKQTAYIDKVRDVGRKEYKEVLCERQFKDKEPQKGVVMIMEASTKTHGFNGCIGIFPGHPSLADSHKPAARPPTLDLKGLDLEEFIHHRLSSGNKPDSTEAVMEEWKRLKSNAVVVSLKSSESAASPLTEVCCRLCSRVCLSVFPCLSFRQCLNCSWS